MPYKPAKRKSCEAIHCSISILVILCIVSFIAAIVFGVLIAKPGLLGFDFEDATCYVKSFEYRADSSCDCRGVFSDDPYCQSKFPCLQITVAYEPRRDVIHLNQSENMFQQTALLHESQSDFGSKHIECSFHHCHPEYKTNKLKVEQFWNKYGTIKSFYPCKYNTKNKNQVITSLRYGKKEVLLALIIPLAVLFLSIIAITIICAVRCRRTAEKARNPIINPFAVKRNYMGKDMPAFEPDEAVENMNKLPDPFASINDMLSENVDTEDKVTEKLPPEEDKVTEKLTPEEGATEQQNYGSTDVPVTDIVPQSAQMSTAM